MSTNLHDQRMVRFCRAGLYLVTSQALSRGRTTPDIIKAALAGAEKKRLQAALQARYTGELTAFTLPPEFADKLVTVGAKAYL